MLFRVGIIFILVKLALAVQINNPNWLIDPSSYQFTATMTAELFVNYEASVNQDNQIAAFVGSEIRALAKATIVGSELRYFMTLYSNDQNELMQFKLYLAESDTVIDINENITFLSNQVYGTASVPFQLNAIYNFDHAPKLLEISKQTIELNGNFISIDLDDYLIEKDNDPVVFSVQNTTNLIASIDTNNILSVLVASASWIGEDSLSLLVEDQTVNQKSTNYKLYYKVTEIDNRPELQAIPNQVIGLFGNFNEIDLNTYHSEQDGDETEFSLSWKHEMGTDFSPIWSVNPADFQYSMNLTAEMKIAGIATLNEQTKLGVFSGGNLRGFATATIDSDSLVRFFLTIYSNTIFDELDFKVYDPTTLNIMPVQEKIIFEPNKIVGTTSEPLELNAGYFIITINKDLKLSSHVLDTTYYGSTEVKLILKDKNTNKKLSDSTDLYLNILNDHTPLIRDLSDQRLNYQEDFFSINLSDYKDERDGENTKWSFSGNTQLLIEIRNDSLFIEKPSADWTGQEFILLRLTDQTANAFFSEKEVEFSVSGLDHKPELAAIPDLKIGFNESFPILSLNQYLTELDNDEIIWDFKIRRPISSDSKPDWQVNSSSFFSTMTVTAVVNLDHQQVQNRHSTLAAFNGNEVRGVSEGKQINDSTWYYFLTVYGDNNDSIHFKIYDSESKNTINLDNNINFIANDIWGTPTSPYELKQNNIEIQINSIGNLGILKIDSWLGERIIKISAMDKNTKLNLFDTTSFNISSINDASPIIKNYQETVYRTETFQSIDLDTMLSFSDGDSITWSAQSSINLTAIIDSENILSIGWNDENWFGRDSILIMATEETNNQLSSKNYYKFNRIFSNTAPVISFSDTISFNEDDSLEIQLRTIVRDNESSFELLNFELRSLNSELLAGINNDILTVKSLKNSNGSGFNLELIATDDDGLKDTALIPVKIIAVNDAPEWNPLPVIKMNEDDSISIDLSKFSNDIDFDSLRYEVTSENPFIKTEIKNNILKITADKDYFANNILINLSVIDPSNSRAETFTTLNIKSVNDAPVISTIPKITISEDDSIVLDLENYISDVDNSLNYLTWSSLNENDSIKISFESHLIKLRGIENYYNENTKIAIVLTDPKSASDTAYIDLSISPINDAPEILKTFPSVNLANNVNHYFYFYLKEFFIDVDNPVLNYKITGGAELSIEIINDSLFFTSSEFFSGTEDFTIIASDDDSLSAELHLSVNYVDNQAPILLDSIADIFINEDFGSYSIALKNHFSDPDSDQLLYRMSESKLFQTEFRNDSLILISVENKSGSQMVYIEADDRKGRLVYDTFHIQINALNDAPIITEPIPNLSMAAASKKTYHAYLPNYFSDSDSENLNYLVSDNSFIQTELRSDSLFIASSIDFIANQNLIITAYDQDSAFVSQTLMIHYLENNAPILLNKLPDLNLSEDFGNYQYIKLSDYFNDQDHQNIIYGFQSNHIVNLSIDSISSTVYFSSIENVFGKDTIYFSAVDPLNEFVVDTMIININGFDEPLYSQNTINDTSILEDSEAIFFNISNLFVDPDNDFITTSIKYIDTRDLDYTLGNNHLSIKPKANVNGVTEIILEGKSTQFLAQDTIKITIIPVDDAPVLVDTLEDINLVQFQKNYKLELKNRIEDIDNDQTEFTYSLSYDSSFVEASVELDSLLINTINDQYGESEIVVGFHSNGKNIFDTLHIHINDVLAPDLNLGMSFDFKKLIKGILPVVLKSNEELNLYPTLEINDSSYQMITDSNKQFSYDYQIRSFAKLKFKAIAEDLSQNTATDSFSLFIFNAIAGKKNIFTFTKNLRIISSKHSFKQNSYIFYKFLNRRNKISDLIPISETFEFTVTEAIETDLTLLLKLDELQYDKNEKRKIALYKQVGSNWEMQKSSLEGNDLRSFIKESGVYQIFYDESRVPVPDHYKLHQNYPNPFNPVTNIAFDLKESSRVSLIVYNILGQKIKTLVSGPMNAGYHQLKWNGKNNFGESVASGIYFYRIISGSFVQSRKMIFLK